MSESEDTVLVTVVSTEDLTTVQRSLVIDVCVSAHNNDDLKHLFTYIPSGGRHLCLRPMVLVAKRHT